MYTYTYKSRQLDAQQRNPGKEFKPRRARYNPVTTPVKSRPRYDPVIIRYIHTSSNPPETPFAATTSLVKAHATSTLNF